MTDDFSCVMYSARDSREINLGGPSSQQNGQGKQIFAEEENRSRLSMDSQGMLVVARGWSSRNKKNIAIFSLILLIVVLVGIDLHRMAGLVYLPRIGSGTTITIDVQIKNRTKWAEDYFLVTCKDSCMDMDIMLASESGEAGLHVKSDGPPGIAGTDCPSCDPCKPGSSNGIERCERVNAWPRNPFYVAVVAHTDYMSAELRVSGHDLQSVTVYQPSFKVTSKEVNT